MFAMRQKSALSFPTTITRFDCDVPEHRSRPICQRASADRPGGGHRRNLGERLSVCTENDFSMREVQMFDACSLIGDSNGDASALQQSMCPSLACAEALTSLLDDCTESIDHLDDCSAAAVDCSVLSGVDCASQAERCQQSTLHKQYYAEMQRSAMYAGCAEMEENHAQFAAVEVQVRAPSLEAVDQIMEAHQAMADMFNQPGGCSGRRSLRDDDKHCAAKFLMEQKQNQRLKAELSATKTLLERSHAVIRNKDERIAELELQLSGIINVQKNCSWRSDQLQNMAQQAQTGTFQRQLQEQVSSLAVFHRTDSVDIACLMSPCDFDACKHGGTCTAPVEPRIVIEGSFRCICVTGYEGSQCESEVDECQSSPCQNGGACADGLDDYSCDCAGSGYEGDNCMDDVDECASNPCDHNAGCADSSIDVTVDVGIYYCTCIAGYSGLNCDGNIDECLSTPCQHGGQCGDGVNGYSCECFGGFGGYNCRTQIGGLVEFKASGNGMGLESWVEGSDPCDGSWRGVECSNWTVTGLILDSRGDNSCRYAYDNFCETDTTYCATGTDSWDCHGGTPQLKLLTGDVAVLEQLSG
eukprot:SAG11_NODE_4842_length_1749_cov_1.461818_1_plen_583_part_11